MKKCRLTYMKFFLAWLGCCFVLHVSAQSITDTVLALPNVVKVSSGLKLVRPTYQGPQLTKGMADALREASGIFLKSYGNGQLTSLSVRGTGAAQTDVLWNGIKLNSPSLGQVDVSLFSLGMMEHVELQGTSNGGNVGGELSIYNNMNFDSVFEANVVLSYGSFNTVRAVGKAKFSNRKVYGSTRMSYAQSDNDYKFINPYKANHPEEKLTNAHVQMLHFMQQFGMKVNANHSLHLNLWLSDAQRAIPPVMSKPLSKEEQDDYSLRSQLIWKGRFKGLRTEWTSAFLHDVIYYRNPEIALNQKSIMQALRNNLLLSYDSLKQWNVYAELGYDFERAVVPAYERIRVRHIGKLSAGVKYAPLKQLWLQLNVREHLYDKMLSPFSGSFEVGYADDLNGNRLKFVLKASRNFRFPTLNDLYWVPGGNITLKTEKSWDGELMGSYAINHFMLKATGFCKYIDNLIQWQSNGSYWEPQNVKRVLSRGVEVSSYVFLYKNDFLFRAQLNYTYTRATNLDGTNPFDQSKGKQLIYVPYHVANGILRFEYKRYFLRLVNNYTASVFISTDNSQALKGYYLLNVEAGKDFVIKDKVEIGFSFLVNNITGANYQNVAQRPMPGRNYEGVIRFNLQ